MLLSEISSMIFQAVRARLDPAQIILIMDAVQHIAFDHPSNAFKVWNQTLTIYHELAFDTTLAYTNAIPTDIGKPVAGLSSTASATLISYDNSSRIWIVLMNSGSADFIDGEGAGVTGGTGLGFLAASDSFLTHQGPYAAPTDPPCSKIWGITTYTDKQIFGTQLTPPTPLNDFDFFPTIYNPAAFFVPGRENNVDFTFTFSQRPTAGVIYRWVYWRDSPDITGTSDETQLQIPKTYHFAYVNACLKVAQITLNGDDVDPKVIDAFFQPWWNTLDRVYTPMGKATNQTLNPRGNSQSLI